ncbi:MAG: rRNA maturation RNase YbeY [Gammaproteobacteria bacterium]
MNVKVEIANECNGNWCPDENSCRLWLEKALQFAQHPTPSSISLRFVDSIESARLNAHYRGKDSSTNVLSFPASLPAAVSSQLSCAPLGDIVVCPAVVESEATDQGKSLEAHWAHMLVHGCLHLLGFDHQQSRQADAMESLEIRALESLGFDNPYLIG